MRVYRPAVFTPLFSLFIEFFVLLVSFFADNEVYPNVIQFNKKNQFPAFACIVLQIVERLSCL